MLYPNIPTSQYYDCVNELYHADVDPSHTKLILLDRDILDGNDDSLLSADSVNIYLGKVIYWLATWWDVPEGYKITYLQELDCILVCIRGE